MAGGSRGRKRPQRGGYGSAKNGYGGAAKRGKFEKISNKEKQHLKEFGEAHPATLGESENVNYKKVRDEDDYDVKRFQKKMEEPLSCSSESENEEENAYKQLVESLPCQDDDSYDENESDDTNESENEDQEEDDNSDEIDSDDIDSDSSSLDDGEEMESRASATEKKHTDNSPMHSSGEESVNENNEVDTDTENEGDGDGDPLKEDLKQVSQLPVGTDPFTQNFEREITQDVADKLLITKPVWKKEDVKIPHVGDSVFCSLSDDKQEESSTEQPFRVSDLRAMHVKQSLCDRFNEVNKNFCQKSFQDDSGNMTLFQQSTFSVMNQYQDLFYCDRTASNSEQIRVLYCLHALNHALKTRSRVMAHSSKIKNRAESSKKQQTDSEDHRDQGLTRPKVLMVLPFRDSALRVVNILSELLSADQSFVTNRTRFMKEFGDDEPNTTKGLKPEDFEETFSGNTDDHFRIGLGIAKKSLKLYTEFYASDIILASPLGLRTVIGAEGDADRDFDFLSSIEVLIFDQLDVILMQNWEHVTHLMSHMHRQPKESHGVDFSRVRMWCINGWSKLYRQTLAFSSICTAEINSVFNQHCFNYRGKYFVNKATTDGSICHVITSMSQKFYRIHVDNPSRAVDARFEFFIKKILPRYTDEMMAQTLVFISSYFDFVRLRNHFKKNETSYVELCEYTPEKTISKSRYMFFDGKTHFLLFTQRFHYYRRYRLRGIKHLIFYDLPHYPHFYHEICNMTRDHKSKSIQQTADDCLCSVLYTRLDWYRLCGVVGSTRAAQMLQSDSDTHLFVTGDSNC